MKNNFRLLVVALGIIAVTPAIAQKDNVGIGTTKPDQSAVLDVSSSTKGLLMPRMSLQQRSSIQNPAQGLVVFQTDFISGFYFYDGDGWKPLTSTAANSVADANNWGLTGNTGINPATNFIGNLDAQPINFRINNAKSGSISPSSPNTSLGYLSQLSNTSGTNNTSFGFNTLYTNTTGSHNTAVGYSVLQNSNGNYNMGLGSNALLNNTSGSFNMALGAHALILNNTGAQNSAIGTNALQSNTTGSNNIGIGYNAGYNNQTGDANIFIGANAGFNETGNAKLYISNSNTSTPLVYGDFSTKYLAVGEVATVDRAAATSGGYRLLVKGGMITEKIKVATAGTADWADYVFDDDYKVMSLEAVEAFVKQNKHLPNVPSTQEVIANGNDLGKTDAKLLEKIEELTLYMIEMNKEIKALKAENAKLRK